MRTFPYNRIDQYFSLSASCVHACPGLNASIVCFSTSCLAGLFDIFILLAIFDTMVCVSVTLTHFAMLIISNLNLISVQSWTYLLLFFSQASERAGFLNPRI